MESFNIPVQAAPQPVQQPKQAPKDPPRQRTERRDAQKSETKTHENGTRAEADQQIPAQDESQGIQQGQQTEESNFLAMMLQQMAAAQEGVPAGGPMDAQLFAALQEQLKKDGAENGMELLAALLSANQAVPVTDISALLTQDAGMPVQESGAVTTNAAQLLEILTMGQQGNTQAAQQTQQNGEFAELVSARQNTVQNAAQESGAQNSTAQDGMSGEALFKQSVLQAQQLLKGKAVQGETKEETQPIDIDQLQSKVDANKAANLQRTDFRMQDFAVKDSGKLELPDAKELLSQVRTGIQQGLNAGKNEFVVKLKPDGLGEITVRIAESGGKMALSIFTSSTQVQRMISGEMAGLREVMRPLGVEVQQVVSQEAGNFNTQQQQSNFGGHQHQQFQEDRQSQQYWYDAAEEPGAADEEYVRQSVGSGSLDTYI